MNPENSNPPQKTTPTYANMPQIDSKITKPNYILFIIASVLIFNALSVLTIMFIVFFACVWAYTYYVVSELKARQETSFNQKDKTRAVLLMSLDPLVGQAIYYYRLRSSHSKFANIMLGLGWKIFILEVALYVLLDIAAEAIL